MINNIGSWPLANSRIEILDGNFKAALEIRKQLQDFAFVDFDGSPEVRLNATSNEQTSSRRISFKPVRRGERPDWLFQYKTEDLSLKVSHDNQDVLIPFSGILKGIDYRISVIPTQEITKRNIGTTYRIDPGEDVDITVNEVFDYRFPANLFKKQLIDQNAKITWLHMLFYLTFMFQIFFLHYKRQKAAMPKARLPVCLAPCGRFPVRQCRSRCWRRCREGFPSCPSPTVPSTTSSCTCRRTPDGRAEGTSSERRGGTFSLFLTWKSKPPHYIIM